MRFLFLCVFVLFFEKKSSEGDDSFTRRRVVLVICEAECYQKRRLPAQSTSFTKILVFKQQITSVPNQHHNVTQMPVACDDTWYVCLCSASVV